MQPNGNRSLKEKGMGEGMCRADELVMSLTDISLDVILTVIYDP